MWWCKRPTYCKYCDKNEITLCKYEYCLSRYTHASTRGRARTYEHIMKIKDVNARMALNSVKKLGLNSQTFGEEKRYLWSLWRNYEGLLFMTVWSFLERIRQLKLNVDEVSHFEPWWTINQDHHLVHPMWFYIHVCIASSSLRLK